MARIGRWRRPSGWLALASLLAVALVADAALVATIPATATPTTVSPLPVTLAAVPLTGTTVTAGTAAATTGLLPGLVALSTVTVTREAPDDWKVVLAVTSVAGITGSESLVLGLVGSSTQTLSLTSGVVLPLATSGLTLDASGLLLTAATTSLVFGCHTCSVTAELRITPPASSLPLFVYPYTITTAA